MFYIFGLQFSQLWKSVPPTLLYCNVCMKTRPLLGYRVSLAKATVFGDRKNIGTPKSQSKFSFSSSIGETHIYRRSDPPTFLCCIACFVILLVHICRDFGAKMTLVRFSTTIGPSRTQAKLCWSVLVVKTRERLTSDASSSSMLYHLLCNSTRLY